MPKRDFTSLLAQHERVAIISYQLFGPQESSGVSVVKNLPAKQETLVGSLDWEDPLEKEMATHSSILAWEIPWAKEPVRLVQGVTKSDTTE